MYVILDLELKIKPNKLLEQPFSLFTKTWKYGGIVLVTEAAETKSSLPTMYICKFGQNPSNGSVDSAQKTSYAVLFPNPQKQLYSRRGPYCIFLKINKLLQHKHNFFNLMYRHFAFWLFQN